MHRLEKVCRSWGEMNILPSPFVLLMEHEHFYEEHILCEKSLGQGLNFSLSSLVGALQPAHVTAVGTNSSWRSSGLVLRECTAYTNPPLFLQKLHFLQTSVRSRGQRVVLSLFPLNLVWDLFLVKIAGAFIKPSSRRPLLSVCFHPCLGSTMNADVVGNFWLSIGFFCGNFKALWLVIFWVFKWICLAFRAWFNFPV